MILTRGYPAIDMRIKDQGWDYYSYHPRNHELMNGVIPTKGGIPHNTGTHYVRCFTPLRFVLHDTVDRFIRYVIPLLIRDMLLITRNDASRRFTFQYDSQIFKLR